MSIGKPDLFDFFKKICYNIYIRLRKIKNIKKKMKLIKGDKDYGYDG